MEARRKQRRFTLTKTLSFAAVHFVVAFTVGYALTGSWVVGGLLALVEPALNTVAFYFHENVWRRIEARRREARESGDARRPSVTHPAESLGAIFCAPDRGTQPRASASAA